MVKKDFNESVSHIWVYVGRRSEAIELNIRDNKEDKILIKSIYIMFKSELNKKVTRKKHERTENKKKNLSA